MDDFYSEGWTITIPKGVTCDYTRSDPIVFEYDHDFIDSDIQLSPIVMPLSDISYSFRTLNQETFYGLPGMLADSLPDSFGNRIFYVWLKQNHKKEADPVERLCYLGSRGMGALEFEPQFGEILNAGDIIELESLRQAASDILAQRENFSGNASAVSQLIEVGTSAGGARAKAIIAWNEKTGEVRSGQVKAEPGFTFWILKFDGIRPADDRQAMPDERQHTRIELAYYYMAIACGLDMQECRIIEEGPFSHFVTKRFDRNQENGDKYHMQSLCGIAHMDFRKPGQYGYEEAAIVSKRLGLMPGDIENLYRRMVFNVLGCNNDDHTKNISFLMNRSGKWYLSPAYDIGYAYNPEGMYASRHQMTINGKREKLSLEDILESAKNMNIKRSKAKKIIQEVSAGIKNWGEYAEMAGLTESNRVRVQNDLIIL